MIESFYERFLQQIASQPEQFQTAYWRFFAGHRFLYVASPLRAAEVTSRLLDEAGSLSKGTILSTECIYVRTQDITHVYRFRFMVPNEKQFCCGNLCADCIRLRAHR